MEMDYQQVRRLLAIGTLIAIIWLLLTGMYMSSYDNVNLQFAKTFTLRKYFPLRNGNISDVIQKLAKSAKNIHNSSGISKQNSSKLVLIWMSLYKTVRTFRRGMKKCAYKCSVTADKRKISQADAVLFEVEGVYKLPRKSKMGQVWVYIDMESPQLRGNGVAKWGNLFNWTWSYRRDSDVPTMYGAVIPKVSNKNNSFLNKDFSVNKTDILLWFVSHCRTASKREVFVKNLRKYMPVDIIGRCGRNICRRGKSCDKEMLNGHKFYLAFENSNCRDYITEKIFKTLFDTTSILPVVRGGVNYSLYLAPASYIDVASFNSTQYLSEFLVNLSKTYLTYNRYFHWKQNYRSKLGLQNDFNPYCELCRKLHHEDKYRRLYRNMHDWLKGNPETSGNFCS